MLPEQQILELKLKLPAPPEIGGVYQPVIVVGDLAYVSGHVSRDAEGKLLTGRVGGDLTLDQGRAAARAVALSILATLRDKLGSLDRVERLVKSLGFVNATPDYTQHPQVINGYSELMAEVFGPDKGVGTRSALGAGSLPSNCAVEVEAIFQLRH